MASFEIDAWKIRDWASFHDVFAEVLAFPEFYGRNLNAWIDCMSDLHGPTALGAHELPKDEPVELRIPGAEDLAERLPDVWLDLVACTAAVNRRYRESKSAARILLVPR